MVKKLLLLFFSVVLIYSCKKNNGAAPEHQVVTGTLRYSNPAADGQGLYFVTDNTETLIIEDDTADMRSLDPKYSDFVNIYSRLTFTYNGEKGCLWSMVPGPCANPLRKVIVNKLEKL